MMAAIGELYVCAGRRKGEGVWNGTPGGGRGSRVSTQREVRGRRRGRGVRQLTLT
jgi:hypothetical protein